ncbi:MAG TPA: heavy metal-binding domain-containing protein, partial [Ktedonobacterales bacterium]
MPRRRPAGGGPGPGVSQQVPLDQRSGPVEMPASALERLKSMEGEDGQRRLFTSDLSTNEFLLIKEAGFDPVGVVVGSSIYHVGYQPVYTSGLGLGFGALYADQELTVLSEAKYRARELAMACMEAEAEALGADGIVGVRLDAGEYEWGPDLVEFLAVGTAVRARERGSYRTRFGKPFTSDLSGQDLRTLLQAGYRPLGLVKGTCVYASYQNGLEF